MLMVYDQVKCKVWQWAILAFWVVILTLSSLTFALFQNKLQFQHKLKVICICILLYKQVSKLILLDAFSQENHGISHLIGLLVILIKDGSVLGKITDKC